MLFQPSRKSLPSTRSLVTPLVFVKLLSLRMTWGKFMGSTRLTAPFFGAEYSVLAGRRKLVAKSFQASCSLYERSLMGVSPRLCWLYSDGQAMYFFSYQSRQLDC